jgi:signal transduction histidine kinase/DNA-binding response OmpR family regulator
MNELLLTLEVRFEQDVVVARQKVRQLAGLLGFDRQDQTRISTAVSEVARNAFQYARSGIAEFRVKGRTCPQLFEIVVTDSGAGVACRDEILDETGSGSGIIGARRLVDRFEIASEPAGGTRIRLTKILPRQAPVIRQEDLQRIRELLSLIEPQDPFEEIRRQNHELMRALEDLRRQTEELGRVNQELEDTNRGVVALYAELDEKAEHLRRADQMKSRFLSNMSHEFRTPLNSIIALSRLLQDRVDGDLNHEQEKQVKLILSAAQNLSELVNDLLDLAKIEAGRTEVRANEFQVRNLFSALRGMLRPLLLDMSVDLVFEEPSGIPTIFSDEGKVSQILRNFLSNSLKFTERGEIRVSAARDGDGILFSVSDTGIGIPAKDHQRIFEEFTQLDVPVQRKVKGTGLGLPLCDRLARLLGGRIFLKSESGKGSTFSVFIPLMYRAPEPQTEKVEQQPVREPDPLRTPVLVVEDNQETVLLYTKLLRNTGYQVLPSRTVRQARQFLHQRPRAIILDILLNGEDAWKFLAELKSAPETRHIPVLVISAVDDREKGLALGADAYCIKPVERRWLLENLNALTGSGSEKILLVDDDEMSRHIVKQALRDTRFTLCEATRGADAIEQAHSEKPAAIVLDLVMPGMGGEAVLEALSRDPRTSSVPVVILTSKVLSGPERNSLSGAAAGVLSKGILASDGNALREQIAVALAGVYPPAPGTRTKDGGAYDSSDERKDP